jgi:ArsR family transcriptional regulator, virulence genes transcriptional regulator
MNLVKMKSSAAGATALLKGLANQHRLIILCHLAEGEKSVGELEALLDMRQPHLSQHLARLRRDALVDTRRDSRTIYYRLSSSAAAQVIRLLYDLYCSRAANGRAAARSSRRPRPAVPQERVGRARASAAASRREARRL